MLAGIVGEYKTSKSSILLQIYKAIKMVKLQRKQIEYEGALDMISGLSGILTRIVYWNEINPILDNSVINDIKKRNSELYKELNHGMFNKENILIVDDILRVYGNLNKRFDELYAEKAKKFGIENINDSMCYFDDLITNIVFGD